MSILVKGLTKKYGEQTAVNDVSFEIKKGNIVGFLGPNGAGKSTTMKMITGTLPADAGIVEVDGIDVGQQPLEIKKHIGYLPEHNPLYLDMYVHEFLRFCGGVYGMSGKSLKSRVADLVDLCGLQKEQNKQIGALSKGYRQRVGLAQALVHDPSVLILDEPTTGLDPNQIIEIRNLILSISKDKTVLLSTHIMQEVQALCNRAIIIKEGKLVADQSVNELTEEKEKFTIKIELEKQADLSFWTTHQEVNTLKLVTETEYLLETTKDIRKEILNWVTQNDVDLVGISLEKGNMEEVFHKLTQNN
ncbi:gliding motility-associated ABC transporter ATP-binding subunit GldA [Marivirga tractuosa]|uniref:Protein involved in gliding motility GldA n=1 Tax=Marivirga tractuosa (strain ATCC 23168 / DSM 4126 / NBRC 15989 / NCIMB 1408 / VKM B-1430 / H-43) TaxID=643867 RepID=E4TMZ1_MARTH|nr:gliding motility-associated ABC transporter ATP-binding subunit GldA [Marivirga tractuosa]ADR21422.1 protein involved in gliding motility GldA [Marivirga tractuosa DSM 4126]BDD14124.1 gliding motility-associated ABC transporter ATP-binding subunit GldA [Marivirga tractuosa]